MLSYEDIVQHLLPRTPRDRYAYLDNLQQAGINLLQIANAHHNARAQIDIDSVALADPPCGATYTGEIVVLGDTAFVLRTDDDHLSRHLRARNSYDHNPLGIRVHIEYMGTRFHLEAHPRCACGAYSLYPRHAYATAPCEQCIKTCAWCTTSARDEYFEGLPICAGCKAQMITQDTIASELQKRQKYPQIIAGTHCGWCLQVAQTPLHLRRKSYINHTQSKLSRINLPIEDACLAAWNAFERPKPAHLGYGAQNQSAVHALKTDRCGNCHDAQIIVYAYWNPSCAYPNGNWVYWCQTCADMGVIESVPVFRHNGKILELEGP